jgi:hypothetical protein
MTVVIAYQHVTCAKVDYPVLLALFGFRACESLDFRRPSLKKETIKHQNVKYVQLRLKRHSPSQNEVNDKTHPSDAGRHDAGTTQPKAEGATPHVFSVTDGFQPK